MRAVTASTPQGLLPAIMVLSIAQAAIGQFVAHGVPLFLRAAGQPTAIVGLVFLASLPFVLNVLWAPVVDRFRNPNLGHYRAWILFGHIGAFIIILGLSLADPGDSPLILIGLVLCLSTVMATQDVSLSGLMVRGLSPKDRAKGSSYRTAGAALAGTVIGALVIYLLADLGWSSVVFGLAAFAVASTLLVFVLGLDRGWTAPETKPSLISQFNLFKKPAARRLMVVEIFTGLGLAVSFGLKSILLIDAGFSVGDAALLSLVGGGAVGLLAIMAIRPLIDAFGGFTVLAGIALVSVVFCLIFAVIFRNGFGHGPTAIFVLLASALTFGAVPASRSILIGVCGKDSAATDFSAFNSLERVILMVFAGAGLASVELIGLSGLLIAAAIGASIGTILAWRLRHTEEIHIE